MKIVYIPSDMDAPGCYRCLFPGRQLSLHGHQVALPPQETWEDDEGKRKVTFMIDLENPQGDLWVLQQRRERMWVEEGVMKLRKAGIATVADVDDNYEELPYWNPAFQGTHPYRRDDGVIVNRAARRKLPKPLQKVPNKNNREHMKAVFSQVDAMTVSTPYLKDLYSSVNGDITVIRNYVDWDIFGPIKPMFERRPKRLSVGYLGVFSYRRGDLEVIKDVVPKFMARHPEVDFVANSASVHDFLGVPTAQRKIVGEYDFWPHDGGDYPLGKKTAVCDIGLAPLTPGGMAEGKSHLKGMEYNAAGIPFIASNTESYRYWTAGNGFIANTAEEWHFCLEQLVTDKALRREMGACGREKANKHSIQRNWAEYADLYDRVLGDGLTAIARGAVRRGAVQKISELRSLLELASERSLRTVVEVGSAAGGTFWALAQVANDDALLVSIDIPGGSPIDTRNGADVYQGRDRERMHRYVREGQRSVLIDSNSQLQETLEKLLDVLGNRFIDLLLIDADHRYKGVKRDYELYAPLVREGGIIAFHDVIRQNDPRSGVHVLWSELKHKHPTTREWVGKDNWGLGSWGGIGVIVKGPSLVRN